MEIYLGFLLKSSAGIALFYLTYWFLLRRETFYDANRFYLLLSLAISLTIPLFPLQYPKMAQPEVTQPIITALDHTLKNGISVIPDTGPVSAGFDWVTTAAVVYLTGALLIMLRLIIQTLSLLTLMARCGTNSHEGFSIVENEKYMVPFSFLGMIFINPKIHKQADLPDILAHEKVHIREFHWFDLVIVELLTVVFWFNPFIWFFERSVKQNHEYLADRGVLSLGYQAGRYQALLVNQLMGVQVVGITNNLNFALGSNRLKMMTKMKTKKFKKLKFLFILPILAILMYSFAVPRYEQTKTAEPNVNQPPAVKPLKIKGFVTSAVDNEPLPGTSVILKGKTIGTVSNLDGSFSVTDPEPSFNEKDGTLRSTVVFSFVGFQPREITASADKRTPLVNINCSMMEEKVGAFHKYDKERVSRPNTKPSAKKDETAETVPVKNDTGSKEEVFIVVEEMPAFPGGSDAFYQFINEMQAKQIKEKEIKGKAYISFVIDKNGKVTRVEMNKSDNELTGNSALSIIKNLPDWKPGKQHGKAVPVKFVIGIEY